MTREEAIKKLEHIRRNYPTRYIENIEADTALYMAIQALKFQGEYETSQKCKTCKFYDHAFDEKVGTDVCYGCVDNQYYKEVKYDKQRNNRLVR